MRWRRTDAVQDVAALIVVGDDAPDRLAVTLSGKAALLRSLPVEYGDDWAAVFAAPVEAGAADRILPRVEAAIPLYQAAADCWLPVGVVPDAPEHLRPVLWRSLGDRCGAAPPMIVLPRFDPAGDATGEGDVYLIRGPIPFARSALSTGPDQ